jgi:hypothetical protein
MFWHEVRLFACYPETGSWENSDVIIYEVASHSFVLQWTRRRNKRWYSQGGLNADQHQALCALIAAKTGLPLYDLSKGQLLQQADAQPGQLQPD